MPYFDTSQQWLEQSSLLIKARPTTTRITTKWSLPRPGSSSSRPRRQKRKVNDHDVTSTEHNASASETISNITPPSATLTLKTYDPVSGVTLKYRTDQAAEVGRLVAIMGRLGRTMAALPDAEVKDDAMADPAGEQGPGTSTPIPETAGNESKSGSGAGGGGQGGGKKKKKGKK